MYPTLFRQKSRLRKDCGLVHEWGDDIPNNASSTRDIEQIIRKILIQKQWMLLLLHTASIYSDSWLEVKHGADQTL